MTGDFQPVPEWCPTSSCPDVLPAAVRAARALGLDPNLVTVAPVSRDLLGTSYEPCRVEVVGEDGLASLVITELDREHGAR